MSDISQPSPQELDLIAVNKIDAAHKTPMQNYMEILEIFKSQHPDISPMQVAEFASHFLTAFFEMGSREQRMANALMANVYYYHYASLSDSSDLSDPNIKNEVKEEKDEQPPKGT